MHTGDGGRMDDEGFVFVVDRMKDMIVSGGENVYSTEVERAVARYPAVAACAVISVPDAEYGERVHAVVVLRADREAKADDIRELCKTLIGGYKCPRSVAFIAALPMTGAGKVLKRTLREPYWKDQQRQVARRGVYSCDVEPGASTERRLRQAPSQCTVFASNRRARRRSP